MAIKALTGLVPEWFTPEVEKGSDDAARFKLKPLDSKQMVEIQGHRMNEGGISPEGLYRTFEMALIDWENVNDVQDRPLKCTRTNIKAIPIEIIAECGAQAIANSFVSEEDEKN